MRLMLIIHPHCSMYIKLSSVYSYFSTSLVFFFIILYLICSVWLHTCVQLYLFFCVSTLTAM